MLDPAHGCGCHSHQGWRLHGDRFPALLQDLRAQEHRLQVGNLLGRSLPGAVRLLVPHGYRYSCYKIPSVIDPSCPTTVPQASQPCSVADCVLCNVNGGYNDSSGPPRPGTAFVRRPVRGRRASGAAPARRPGHARLARDAEKEQFQPAPAARSSIRHHPMAKQHNGLTSRKRATSLWLGALGAVSLLFLAACGANDDLPAIENSLRHSGPGRFGRGPACGAGDPNLPAEPQLPTDVCQL